MIAGTPARSDKVAAGRDLIDMMDGWSKTDFPAPRTDRSLLAVAVIMGVSFWATVAWIGHAIYVGIDHLI